MAGFFTEAGKKPESEKGKGLEQMLTGKIGGIPVFVIVIAGVVLVWWYESKRSASAPATSSTTAAAGTTGSATPQQYAAAYEAANPTSVENTAYFAGSANESGYTSGAPGNNTTPQGAPTVSGINPTTGPPTGGGTAVITGTNLTGATGVNFGGTPAAFSIANSSTIYVTVPTDQTASGGNAVQITVVTPGGSATGPSFTYAKPATATAATPGTPGAAAPSTAGYGVVPTKQGTMIYLGTVGGTGYEVGGGAPVYFGNATTLEVGNTNRQAGQDVYTPVAYASQVAKSPIPDFVSAVTK